MIVNEIKLNTDTDQPRVDSRIVAKGFGIEHDSLSLSLKKYFTDLKSVNINKDIGRPQKAFLLSERQIAILPAITKPTAQTIAFQIKLVDAFLAMRVKLSFRRINSGKQLTDREQAIIVAKQLIESEKEISRLNERVEEMAPKELFHDTVTASNEWMPLFTFGKISGIGARTIFDILLDRKYLYWNEGRRIPYDEYDKKGLLKLKATTYQGKEGERKPSSKVYVSPQGQAFFTHLLIGGQLRLEGK